MNNDLFEGAQRILVERLVWENKIRRFCQMQRGGLPRRDKTESWQSDGHSQTIDRAIRKSKPFWLGQVTAGDRLCNFTALTEQLQTLSDAAADFYDFDTHTHSDLMKRLDTAVFHMLLKGRGIILSVVDPLDKYKIVDTAKDPMFILMPESANGFEDTDEWVDIDLMTVAQYRMLDDRYDTSEDTIKKIRGTKEFLSLGIYQQEMQLREGITHTTNSNYILMFKHWTRSSAGHNISYYSPNAPDIELRKSHPNPYKWQGKESIPYTSFQMEIVEDGWYAPRGLGEMLEVQELTETFIENKRNDALSIANTRIFTGEKEIQNMANLRMKDGQYIPGSISSVQFAPPPMRWEDVLNYEKSRSEEISQVPDSSSVAPSSKTGGKAITATESNHIAALVNNGMNYQSELFRRDLIKLHRHRWGMICQFRDRDFAYYASNTLGTLPDEAIHDKYLITPDGSADGWNRQARIQRDIGYMQTFAPLPNSNPDYWVEKAMRSVSGIAAQKGFKGTGGKQAEEYEAQASEILLLTAVPPFPVQPQPDQDQATRIKCILDWLMASHQKGIPVNPDSKMRVFQNLNQRMQILQKQNPSQAKQIKQMMMQVEQQAMQPQGQMPQAGQPQLPPQ